MKLTKCKIIKIIELVISLFLAILPLFFKLDEDKGLLLDKPISYIPIILLLILFIFVIVEFIFSTPFIRIIYLVVAIFSSLMMLEYSLSEMNASVWLFGLIFIPLTIVSIFKTHELEGKRKYPNGIITKKHLFISFGTLIISVIVAIIIFYLWWQVYDKNFIVGLLFVFLIIFVTYLPAFILSDPIRKITKEYNASVNYNSLKNKIENILSDNRLNENTKAYVMIIYANYSYYKNPSLGEELFDLITPPSYAPYKNLYDQVNISNLLFKRDYENAYKKIEELAKNPKTAPLVASLYNYINVFNTTNFIDNIEVSYPTNTINKYVNIINEFILMNYYSTRGYNDKSHELADKLLSYSLDLDYINECANNIRNNENV